jgi:hypothetical protein
MGIPTQFRRIVYLFRREPLCKQLELIGASDRLRP